MALSSPPTVLYKSHGYLHELVDLVILSCGVKMCVAQNTLPNILYSEYEKRYASFDLDYWKNESWNSSPKTLAYIGMFYVGVAFGDEVRKLLK